MQQLSSLDAQFLALESDRNYGHVGSLAILDPSTAENGEVTIEAVREQLQKRLHLIPPFTSRLAGVPLGIDWPYWVRDDHFDIGYHCRELALPKPGQHGTAPGAGGAHLLASARLLATALGAVFDPRPRGWARGPDDEDPSCRGRRHVRRRDHDDALWLRRRHRSWRPLRGRRGGRRGRRIGRPLSAAGILRRHSRRYADDGRCQQQYLKLQHVCGRDEPLLVTCVPATRGRGDAKR